MNVMASQLPVGCSGNAGAVPKQRLSLEHTTFSNSTHGSSHGSVGPIKNLVPPGAVLNPEPWNVTVLPPPNDGELSGSTLVSVGASPGDPLATPGSASTIEPIIATAASTPPTNRRLGEQSAS